MKQPEQAPCVTTTQLASIFGVSIMSVTNWRRAGMPRVRPNHWDLAACVQWRLGRIEAATTGDASLLEERRRLIVEQRRGQEIDNAERLGELLPAAEVHMHLQALAKVVCGELDKLTDVAHELVDVGDPAQARRILEAACRQTRVAVAESWQRYAENLPLEGGLDHGD